VFVSKGTFKITLSLAAGVMKHSHSLVRSPYTCICWRRRCGRMP